MLAGTPLRYISDTASDAYRSIYDCWGVFPAPGAPAAENTTDMIAKAAITIILNFILYHSLKYTARKEPQFAKIAILRHFSCGID